MFSRKCLIGVSSQLLWSSLPLRLALGGLLAYHGYLKVFGGIEGFAQALANMGFFWPLFFAWFVGFLEFLGGLSLVTGVLAPFFSFLLSIQFVIIVGFKLSKNAEYIGVLEWDILILGALITTTILFYKEVVKHLK